MEKSRQQQQIYKAEISFLNCRQLRYFSKQQYVLTFYQFGVSFLGETDETVSDEFLVESALTENSQTNKEADSLSSERQPAVPQKPVEQPKPQAKPPDVQVEKPDQPPAKKFAAEPTNQPKPDQLTATKPKPSDQTKEQDRLVQELKSVVVKTVVPEQVKEQQLKPEIKSKGPGQIKEQDQLVQELKAAVAKTQVVTKESSQVKVRVEKQFVDTTTDTLSSSDRTLVPEKTRVITDTSSSTRTLVPEKPKLTSSPTTDTSSSSDKTLVPGKGTSRTTTNTSNSSDRTLVPEPFPTLATTTTTTTDVFQSEDSETLKQVQTPESEAVEEHHLQRIQAVEPLVQINKPRVLEEVVPYVIKPPPELVPGSAVDKLFSVEKSGVSDIILTDFKVGVEVNVEVGDEMSRRYTSSARSGQFLYHGLH